MNEIPTEALYDLSRPMQVAASPDGSRVAVQTLEYDPDEDDRRFSVFTVPADGSRDPYRLTRVSDASTMRWSPDGERLGVVMTRERDVELRVGRADAGRNDSEDPGGHDADAPHSDTEAESDGTDDGPSPQVWVYDLDRGGDARQVTDRDEGVRDFDWGPEGERIVVAARDPTDEERAYLDQRREDGPIETERLQHKYTGSGWLDTVTTYLFVVDVDNREERRLDDAYGGGIYDHATGLQPAWHPTDDRIAFCAYHGEDGDDTYVHDVHVVDVESGDVEQITAGEYQAASPTWSPDGERLAFTASDPVDLYVPTDVCVADGNLGEYRVVTDGLDRSLAWFEQVAWLNDDSLLTAIGDDGWSRFVRLSVENGPERVYDCQSRDGSLMAFDASGGAQSGESRSEPAEGSRSAGADGSRSAPADRPEDGTVAFVLQHPQEGVDVFGVDVAGLVAAAGDDDPRKRLTDMNPDYVADYDHPDVERFTFNGADGDAVEAVTFLPPGFDPDDPDGDRPLLLSIHGGPRRYDEPHFDFDTAFWSTRGYVVCKVNYHGSTSYGRDFCERLNGDWNGVEVEDLLAGTDELVDRGWVDPDRLFVTGFSYGGRATAFVLTQTDRFAAGVAEHGTYDMRSTFGTADSHTWQEIEFGLPWEDPEAYDAASSLTDVDAIDTPLLLTAGETDWRCPPTQAEQLHVSLRKRGVASKLVVYPDTHHVHYYIAEPDRAIHRLEALESWFERFDPGS